MAVGSLPILGMNNSQMIRCIFVTLVNDLTSKHSWFSQRSCRLTVRKIDRRLDKEGLSFLTKALPRLGKSLDKALTGALLDCTGFRKKPGTELPIFMGEFFERVFHIDGRILHNPCLESIIALRDVLNIAYKLELPYDISTKDSVIDSFVANDDSLPGYFDS